VAGCKFCGKEIFWTKEGRKNVPTEVDGAVHQCENMQRSRASLKVFDRSQISPEELAKYESAMNSEVNKKK